MLNVSVRYPYSFMHDSFLIYMKETTKKFIERKKNDVKQFFAFGGPLPASPPSGNSLGMAIFLSLSSIGIYFLYNKSFGKRFHS